MQMTYLVAGSRFLEVSNFLEAKDIDDQFRNRAHEVRRSRWHPRRLPVSVGRRHARHHGTPRE